MNETEKKIIGNEKPKFCSAMKVFFPLFIHS